MYSSERPRIKRASSSIRPPNFRSQQFGLDARVSQETATLVDVETRRILEEAVDEASSILKGHRQALDSLADLLCDQETVDGAQIEAILGQNEKRDEVEELPKPALNGHKKIQRALGGKDTERLIDEIELDDLPRWEDEGGQISNRVPAGESSVLQGDSMLLERSPENASI